VCRSNAAFPGQHAIFTIAQIFHDWGVRCWCFFAACTSALYCVWIAGGCGPFRSFQGTFESGTMAPMKRFLGIAKSKARPFSSGFSRLVSSLYSSARIAGHALDRCTARSTSAQYRPVLIIFISCQRQRPILLQACRQMDSRAHKSTANGIELRSVISLSNQRCFDFSMQFVLAKNRLQFV
jgi:hypothetical protein